MTKTRDNADYPNREYLDTEAGNFNQSVKSTGTTDFAGDVTLGTDKITLDATDGSAVFDAVEIQTVAGLPTVRSSTGGLGLESQNNIQFRVNETEKMRFDSDRAAFYFDDTTPSDANLIINNFGDIVSKGSAGFAGGVTSGDDASDIYALRLKNNSSARPTMDLLNGDSNGALLIGYTEAYTNPTCNYVSCLC